MDQQGQFELYVVRRKSPDRISRDAEQIISVLEVCCKRRVVMLQPRTIRQQIETSEATDSKRIVWRYCIQETVFNSARCPSNTR